MEIRIQLKDDNVLSICIGKNTSWYSSANFISIIKEYYEKGTYHVNYADLLWHSGMILHGKSAHLFWICVSSLCIGLMTVLLVINIPNMVWIAMCGISIVVNVVAVILNAICYVRR